MFAYFYNLIFLTHILNRLSLFRFQLTYHNFEIQTGKLSFFFLCCFFVCGPLVVKSGEEENLNKQVAGLEASPLCECQLVVTNIQKNFGSIFCSVMKLKMDNFSCPISLTFFILTFHKQH